MTDGAWVLQIACGYVDGTVRIWDAEKGTCETTLNGHRSAVTILRYNNQGSLLASGSKDCDIILWDVIGEAGLFRLQGHRDQVYNVFKITDRFYALQYVCYSKWGLFISFYHEFYSIFSLLFVLLL